MLIERRREEEGREEADKMRRAGRRLRVRAGFNAAM